MNNSVTSSSPVSSGNTPAKLRPEPATLHLHGVPFKDERCGNCRYHHHDRCHYWPPMSVTTRWQPTMATEWCGQWAARNGSGK